MCESIASVERADWTVTDEATSARTIRQIDMDLSAHHLPLQACEFQHGTGKAIEGFCDTALEISKSFDARRKVFVIRR